MTLFFLLLVVLFILYIIFYRYNLYRGHLKHNKDKEAIIKLYEIDNYLLNDGNVSSNLKNNLIGRNKQEIYQAWGKSDAQLVNKNGYAWNIKHNNKLLQVFLYFDDTNLVNKIRIEKMRN